MNRLLLILAGAVGLFSAGLGLGWWLNRPAVVVELPAPAVRQGDGSLVVERVDTKTQPAKPPHALPAGSKEERWVSVVVQPPRGVVVPSKDSAEAARLVESVDHPAIAKDVPDSCDCPPVQVDLSLVRMPDKTRRVIASSPDGKILSGVDVPIDPGELPARRPWAAGIMYTADRKFGGFLDRDLGPFRFGVEAFQTTTGWGAATRAGIRF